MKGAFASLLLLMPALAAAAEPDAPSCAQRLAAVASYTSLPARQESSECAADDLIRLDRVIMPDRSTVNFNPPPILSCPMAEAVSEWLRSDLGPLTVTLGAPLAAVTDLDSYGCRPRNRVVGAKISEHGRGNAIDIGAVKLANGGVFSLTDPMTSKPFREAVRKSACARFTTVLGPGADAYHAGHIHLDLAIRSNGYRICQWDLLEPLAEGQVPLPPRKPIPEAPDSRR